MKRKILLVSLLAVIFACLFVMSASAAYTPATRYNYYKDSVAPENLLYSITTKMDPTRSRFEMTETEQGTGFSKWDDEGNAITWYAISDTKDSNGERNIVVTSALTLGGVGTVDANGNYTYGTGMVESFDVNSIVSANFFGTKVKVLPTNVFMSTGSDSNNLPHATEYTVIADGSKLLFAYLPETLTQISQQMFYRSPVRVVEFENNKVACESISGVEGASPFSFCGNLKEISIPEGIKTMTAHAFRENCSLKVVKLPSTMTRLEANVFRRCNAIETIHFGKNMTYIGQVNQDYTTMKNQGVGFKYMYIPNTVNTANSKFDSYRGDGNTSLISITKNLVFFFVGTKEEAQVVATYTDKHFKAAISNKAITYDEYISDKETYDNYSGHILVYNTPVCLAFHNNEHDMQEQNTYKDALTPFEIGRACSRDNCDYSEDSVKYGALLEPRGYAAKIADGVLCIGFHINQESFEACDGISFGVLAYAPVGSNETAFSPLNPDLTPAVDGKVLSWTIDTEILTDVDFIVKGFNEDYYNREFVMCGYVSDGEKIEYICYNELNEIAQVASATTITYQYVVEESAIKHSVKFNVDDASMGALTGSTSQIVKEGDASSAVTAIPNEGYQFACWSDGSTNPTIEYTPKETTELVAYFTPKSTGLPVMTINTANGAGITTKDYYIGCEITILDTETGASIGGEVAEIKGRGNSTWNNFNKKPYKFKFDSKQNLFGYGSEKTWVLLADAKDYSLIRNMLALNTALSMSELEYSSKGQSVELYLNGVYQGVYYLCEQIQVKKNRVNITEFDEDLVQGPQDLGYLIEMDAWAADGGNQSGIANYTKDGDVFVTVTNGQQPYVIKDPEDVFFNEAGEFDAEKAAPYLEYIQGYIQDCINAIHGTDYNAVCELIDVKSFAQAYIIFDLFKNPDTNYSSVYFYKDADKKLVASPVWDFDMSIGNVTHKANAGTNAQNFRDTTYLWTAEKNVWFRELLEFSEFKDLVGAELQENEATLRATIAENIQYARDHKKAYEKNFTVWNLIGNTSVSDRDGGWSVPSEFKAFETWEEHLDYIENYLNESLAFLLEHYPAPSAEE